MADSVRSVFALEPGDMTDEEALDRVMNPATNPYRLDVLNVSYHSPLMRSLHHVSYVFEKRLSHTADSQDQRHRMVPASRPLMTFADTSQPDFITPRLIAANPRARATYECAMREAWAAKNRLLQLDVPLEFAVPLVFLVLLIPALNSRPAVVAALVGGFGAVAAAELGVGSLSLTVGAVAGIVAGTAADHRRSKQLPEPVDLGPEHPHP